MKPAYDFPGSDPLLQDALNKAAARSQVMSTWVPLPQTLMTDETSYLSIMAPTEAGKTLVVARIIPSGDYRIARYGDWVTIGVGLRTAGRFELLGRAWSSKEHAMTTSEPFDLVTDEQPIRVGQTLVVRVVRHGWPNEWPVNATVESTIGYDPGA